MPTPWGTPTPEELYAQLFGGAIPTGTPVPPMPTPIPTNPIMPTPTPIMSTPVPTNPIMPTPTPIMSTPVPTNPIMPTPTPIMRTPIPTNPVMSQMAVPTPVAAPTPTPAPSGMNFGPEDPTAGLANTPSPQAAPMTPGTGSFTGGGGTVVNVDTNRQNPNAPAPQPMPGQMPNYYNANEQSAALNEAITANPSLAFLNTLGSGYRRNYMLAGAADRYDQFIPVLHGIVQAMGGTADMANFATEFIKGLTSGRGALNIGQLLGDFLGRAGTGDPTTAGALEAMEPNRILGLMELADRQRGINPFLARSRQRIAAERLQEEELARIQRGAATPEGGDTASWARLLTQLSAR